MHGRPLEALKKWLGKPGPGTDRRSRRFVAVIECILDQNVRDRGAASFPAMNHELLQILHEHGIGILQMPCPEIAALGPGRSRPTASFRHTPRWRRKILPRRTAGRPSAAASRSRARWRGDCR